MPRCFFITGLGIEELTVDLVALRMHQFCNTIAELTTDILHRDICIFYRIMQRRSSQQFLVGCDRSDDLYRLHRMNDVRKAFAATLGVMMSLYGEDDRLV